MFQKIHVRHFYFVNEHLLQTVVRTFSGHNDTLYPIETGIVLSLDSSKSLSLKHLSFTTYGAGGCKCSLSNRNRMCIEHDRAEVDSVSIGISNCTTFTDFNRSTSSTLSSLPYVCDVTLTNQSCIG